MLEDAHFLGGIGGEEPQGGAGKDRGEALGLVEGPILVVPEDDNATLGAVWVVVSVAFDP